jgi:hypothetical protein
MVRRNIALTLQDAKRFTEALAYAEAARRAYETLGGSAAADIQREQALVEAIQKAIAERGS